jgi:hypothetical protein
MAIRSLPTAFFYRPIGLFWVGGLGLFSQSENAWEERKVSSSDSGLGGLFLCLDLVCSGGLLNKIMSS